MTISLNRLDEELKFRHARLQTETHALELKLAEIEAQKRQTQQDLDAVRTAFRQLVTFPKEYRRQKICLPCWLKQKQSPLVIVGTETSEENFLKCPICGQRYSEVF